MIETATPPRPASANAPITNMALALQTLHDCMEVTDGSPRFAVFYGPPGYGKSSAGIFAGMRTQAARVEARSFWNATDFLRAVSRDLGLTRERETRIRARLFDDIVTELNARPRPVIIDEMDYLVKNRSVDIVRDLHEAAPRSAFLMVGMESLPACLREWPQFHSRIRRFTPAMPASHSDTLLLRDHYRDQVAIADDLALHFSSECAGVARNIVNNLKHARQIALNEGESEIDLAWWGPRGLHAESAPTRKLPA